MKLEFGSERVGFPLPESIMRIRERVLPARVEKRQNRVDQRVANPRVLEPQARTTRFGAATRPCRSRACLLGSIHRGPFRLPTLALKQAHARPSQNLGQAGGGAWANQNRGQRVNATFQQGQLAPKVLPLPPHLRRRRQVGSDGNKRLDPPSANSIGEAIATRRKSCNLWHKLTVTRSGILSHQHGRSGF
jgi:hypothetical protein